MWGGGSKKSVGCEQASLEREQAPVFFPRLKDNLGNHGHKSSNTDIYWILFIQKIDCAKVALPRQPQNLLSGSSREAEEVGDDALNKYLSLSDQLTVAGSLVLTD